jgi:flagellin FlaB
MGKMMKSLKRFARNKKAISGLETAIVLIAFVIVASAFAYAVLNMGFLATQKSQQVVLGGLAAASSALVVDGPIYGYSTSTNSTIANMTSIIFWLKTASGASAVDLNINKTTIAFQNPRGVWPNVYSNVQLTFTQGTTEYIAAAASTTITWEVGQGMLLTSGQKVRVTINLDDLTISPSSANPVGFGGTNEGVAGVVMKNEEFTIIIKPPVGSVLEIDRVAPAAITTVNDLT